MRNTILLVKEEKGSRDDLRRILKEQYNILEALNGEQALFLLERMADCIAAVLLDLNIPVIDGYSLLTKLAERGMLTRFPVLVLAQGEDLDEPLRAMDLGACDILHQGLPARVIQSRVNTLIELYRHKCDLEGLAQERLEVQRRANEVVVDTLSSIIEYRNAQSGQNIPRIRRLTEVLLLEVARSCPEYGLDERTVQVITSAAALHEIGKISVPDSILNKPGRLSREEYEIMKSHAVVGSQMLAGLKGLGDDEYLRYAYNICRYHHERWDGSGYPEGLVGDEIPICAQAVGLADAYDALTTDRVYQAACSCEQAANMILNGECGAFSPRLLECFKQVREEFESITLAESMVHSGGGEELRLAQLPQSGGLDTLQAAQTKLQTLLAYLDLTAVELDLDQGIFHMLYNTERAFEGFRSAPRFEAAMDSLAREHIHPEDRSLVLEDLDRYLDAFFASGARRQTRTYRVRGGVADEYRRYEATILRLDMNVPGLRKAMVLWRPLDREENRAEVRNVALPGVGQCFRNDRWFTLEEAGSGLCNLSGYREEEICAQFGGRLMEMIHPDDREDVLEQTALQLSRGDMVDLEFRLFRRNAAPLWVLAKGKRITDEIGQEYIRAVLMDNSRSKAVEEGLRLSLERHQIIMDQTNDIVFEWDCATDTLTCSSKWEERFGYPHIREQASVRIPQASHFHPEDGHQLLDRLAQIRGGLSYFEMEARIANSMGRYTWNRLRATVQRDGEGKPMKMVGVIIDIDAQKRSTQDLVAKAERDALTKLLNKNTSRSQVEDYLASCRPKEQSAMLIVDLDNFKLVNDRYGHMLGDAVLTKVAAELNGLFREKDVVARIGGDEFMVFMKTIPNRRLVEERCEKLTRIFRNLYREQLADCDLSCSVGVAFAPEHGVTFEDLFRRADLALYQAKGKGKDCYVCYDAQAGDGIPADFTTISKRIDSDERPGMGDDSLARYMFHRLYESGDVTGTIREILALVGNQMNVSRVYITDEAGVCSFEWCAEGIAPTRDSGTWATAPECFNERGIFYCEDVGHLPPEQFELQTARGVQSLVQCAIRHQGQFRGHVGFDDCKLKRLWTQEQIDLLAFLAEMISFFLAGKGGAKDAC